MNGKTLMVQGTASSAGKSMLVTALCRIFRQDGLRVAPFKAQNMALNSFVTADGGEIGRAQAVQAEAAKVEISVDMNPVLLKPEADARCQVIVRGRPYANLSAGQYYELKSTLWPVVMESLDRLRSQYDLVVIEGAGSPAEVNLREQDIVNMSIALAAAAPVLLVSDIDRGGVFASLVGTLELLAPAEKELVKAFVINKFRGDVTLLQPGLDFLEKRTGVPVAGVIPMFRDIRIAEEDSVALESQRWRNKQEALLDIAIIRLPHISNFDDFDPLEAESEVRLRLVDSPRDLGQPDLILIPGTKTTVPDLAHLRQSGLAEAVVRLVKQGTPLIGICGGYQMLGIRLLDPLGVESPDLEARGLGLLPMETTFVATKHTRRVTGRVLLGKGILKIAEDEAVEGYEIHMGETTGDTDPVIMLDGDDERTGSPDGALSADGLVFGTYLHGLFARAGFRRAILRWLAARKNATLEEENAGVDQDREYDRLASLVRSSLDMSLIYRLAGLS